MNIQDILALLTIAGIIIGGIRWYISIQVKPIKEAVDDIRAETKTNGGSSMRDEIKSIKLEQEHAREKRKQQSDKIDHMYDLLLEHFANKK